MNVRNWLNRITLDDIFAINPGFGQDVELAEKYGTEELSKAETLLKQATTLMETSSNHRKSANRKLNAVKRFRKASGE